MKQPKIYKPHALIKGEAIDMKPGTLWVAVPDKLARTRICVLYNGLQMDINDWKKEAKLFKRFRDKFWREGSRRPQYYTLGYFEFNPTGGF